ncbi:7491_t:CDS:2, partial [Racocetra fulgida]
PLPPYNIIASGDTRFGQVGLGTSDLTKEDLETQAFVCYCAYLIKTSHLVNELLKLVYVIKQLVGVNKYVK